MMRGTPSVDNVMNRCKVLGTERIRYCEAKFEGRSVNASFSLWQ